MNDNEDLLALDISTDDSGTTVSVVGELDPHTVPEFERVLTELIGATPKPPQVTLNLAGVRFIDSSGLRVILSARELLLQQDARLVLRSPSDAVLRLLEITDLLGRIDVEQE